MSQQLHLFSDRPSDAQSLDSSALLEQTRQLFGQNRSNSELIQRILSVTKAIDERCSEPSHR
ncbi:hypothetical protein C7B61_00465 [filamentous cyanobacterium CCP1]|jgi:hypothetical protein|nr:hypothetical protein C7B76_28825 [filamentous cyanobacterium CCP2]PSB68522.1 hypothetical protein C7B61_00465 [filamentous cyanobacterium CCP1]